MLESFFEGPEFDPMFNNAGHAAGLPSAMQAPNAQGLQGDDSESSHGPRSLPVTLSIPLVVTDGEAEAWELGVSSPTKGMITQPFQLSGSLPSSPSKYLPPWLTDSRELDNYDDDFESFDC